MATFDVEYKPDGTRQLRMGDVVVSAQVPRRGSRPELTVTQAGSLLLKERADLADQPVRRRLQRRLKRRGVDVPERALAALTLDPPDSYGRATDPKDAYRVTAGGFVYRTVRKGLIDERQLSNFTAVIEKELVLDDGHEEQRQYQMRVTTGTDVQQVCVPAIQLGNSWWISAHLGAKAILNPGHGGIDHLRAAIQYNSAPELERVYAHTGWRVHAGKHMYLHGKGAIDASGVRADIRVTLPPALGRYVLPEPPEGSELASAVRASLALLELAHDRITVPLLAATYRAVLGPAHTTVHVTGETGVFKTELVALAQQHFGPEMHARQLPASWQCTGAFVGELLSSAKDAVLTVDDFVPGGTTYDVQRKNEEMGRVVRGQGNAIGRGRARPDGSIREPKPPRGLLLSTGEDIPAGHSVRARMLVLDLAAGDADVHRLTACQRDAAAGLYAGAMAAYIKWLAANPVLMTGLRQRVEDLRARVSLDAEAHARTPEAVADLAAGLETFLTFTAEAGILAGDDAGKLMWGRVWPALLTAAAHQKGHQRADDPAARFLNLLRAAITSGKAHVTTLTGTQPANHQTWGWQGVDDLRPQGRHIGWIDGEDLYLQPDAALAAAQEAVVHGQRIAISQRTLHSRLKQKGILATVDDKRDTATIRRTIHEHRQEVLHLKAGTIFEADSMNPFCSVVSFGGGGLQS